MRVGFVILHYLAIRETVSCVESIIHNVHYPKSDIVIVDNGSGKPDDLRMLKEYEEKYRNIHLVCLVENAGFAKGNNAGIAYARNNLKDEIIVCLNNDTLIRQQDFCEVLVRKYEQYQFGILGPRIITNNGINSNPRPEKSYSVFRIRCFQAMLVLMILLSYVNADKRFDKKLRMTQSSTDPRKKAHEDEDLPGAGLDGSCIVFSPEYFKYYDGFRDDAFLYMEEDILCIRIRKAKLLSLYCPEMTVFHLEDAATDLLLGKGRKKETVYLSKPSGILSCVGERDSFRTIGPDQKRQEQTGLTCWREF